MVKGRLVLSGILLASLITISGCKNKERVITHIDNGPSSISTRIEDSNSFYNKKFLEFKTNNQLDSAIAYSQKAIEQGKWTGSRELGNIYFNRAKIFQELGQYENAIAIYDSATKYYLLIHEQYDGASKTALEMAELYKKLGNERLAENYRIKAKIWDLKSKDL